MRSQRQLRYERFVLPDGADYYSLYDQRNEANLGELINVALEAIEDANKAKVLAGLGKYSAELER